MVDQEALDNSTKQRQQKQQQQQQQQLSPVCGGQDSAVNQDYINIDININMIQF